MPPAVILPTVWKYLQILEAPPYFLGLGLSAFSLSGLLTGPLFGFWSDRSGTTKSIVLFSNLFEIAGEMPEHGHMTTARVRHNVMVDLGSVNLSYTHQSSCIMLLSMLLRMTSPMMSSMTSLMKMASLVKL